MVDVVLLSDAMARRLIQEAAISPSVLGITGLEAQRAHIFVDRVRLAIRTGEDSGDMPGSVIAHEIGHIVIGDDSHSTTGIMQPEFGLYERGGRWFARSGRTHQDFPRARCGSPIEPIDQPRGHSRRPVGREPANIVSKV